MDRGNQCQKFINAADWRAPVPIRYDPVRLSEIAVACKQLNGPSSAVFGNPYLPSGSLPPPIPPMVEPLGGYRQEQVHSSTRNPESSLHA